MCKHGCGAMTKADITIIIALALPIDQACDFLRWLCGGEDYAEIALSPSFQWYVETHASAIYLWHRGRKP
jgi:hypothetical protein